MEPSHVLAWACHFPVATHTENGDAEGERNWGHAEPLQCCEPRAGYVPVGDTAAGSVLFSISAVLVRTKCMCVRGGNADCLILAMYGLNALIFALKLALHSIKFMLII